MLRSRYPTEIDFFLIHILETETTVKDFQIRCNNISKNKIKVTLTKLELSFHSVLCRRAVERRLTPAIQRPPHDASFVKPSSKNNRVCGNGAFK